MKHFRKLAAVATGVAVSVTAFAGTASAQSADDVAILLENLPAAADELATGVQGAVDTLATTQSAEQTSAAVGQTIVDSGTALVAGTEQFEALGLGLLLVNLGAQQGLQPYLQAIDDPSTAGDLISPDDLTTLAANAQPTADFAQTNLATALAEGLKGNLVAPGFLDPVTGTPSLLGNTLALGSDLGTGGVALLLTQGTSFQGVATIVPITLLVAGVAAGGAAGEYLVQVEEGAAPAFDAAAPATAPIIAALEGI